MVENAFIGHEGAPTDEEVAAALGRARPLWDRLLHDLAARHGVDEQEWNSYSRKAGWSLRLRKDGRAIVYLTPGRGALMASFALGDKAMQAARGAKFPAAVVAILDGAKRYAEGSAVRLDVKKAGDVQVVVRLAGIKLAS